MINQILEWIDDKSDHFGQLFVTSEMIAPKIKKMKDNKSPGIYTTKTALGNCKKLVHLVIKSKIMSNQSLMFFEEITKCVDDGSPVDGVYLDFHKAFDKVPHQRLLLIVNKSSWYS